MSRLEKIAKQVVFFLSYSAVSLLICSALIPACLLQWQAYAVQYILLSIFVRLLASLVSFISALQIAALISKNRDKKSPLITKHYLNLSGVKRELLSSGTNLVKY